MSLPFPAGLLTPWGQHQGSRDGAQGRATARGRHAQLCRPGSLPPGFSSPCTFVAAVSGANGTVLWERPVAQNRALVECGVPQPRGSGASSACIILGRPGPFIAVDSVTGRLLPVGPPGLHTRVRCQDALRRVSPGSCGRRGWIGRQARVGGGRPMRSHTSLSSPPKSRLWLRHGTWRGWGHC